MSKSQRKEINHEKFLKLYMAGFTDLEIGKVLDVSQGYVCKYRITWDLPNNQGIFSWQTKIKPSEFAKIPVKYRKEGLYVG